MLIALHDIQLIVFLLLGGMSGTIAAYNLSYI